MICIRILLTISHLKSVPYDMNFLQSIINQIGTKKRRLTHFNLPYMRPTHHSIQRFKRNQGYGWIKSIIKSRLHKGKMFIPISLKLVMQSLCISLRVWIVRSIGPSVWGWKMVINFTLVPNPFWNDLQNLDVNITLRSNMMDNGIPRRHKISSMK